MLESLSGFSKREAQGILSSVTLSLLPNPSLEARHSIDEALYRRVLAESREKLSVDQSDETAETRSRVVDFLGNQISESILRGADVDRIKSRLGENGYLRPDEYEITTMPGFEDLMYKFRLNMADISDAVAHPDGIEHLPLIQLQDGSTEGVSFSFKLFGGGHDRYLLIVILLRKGQTMEVQFAFRAFLSDVDIRLTCSPLEALRAFLDRYGMRFRLGHLPTAVFYQQEVLSMKIGTFANKQDLVTAYVQPLENSSNFYACALVRSIESLGLLSFAVVFLVDLEKYRVDLSTHGIDIASPSEVMSKHNMDKLNANLFQGRSRRYQGGVRKNKI
jgi:hypothetical protein